MYAIVDIAGQQFRVEKNQKIYVHRMAGDAGTKVDLDKVLLIGNENNVIVGSPVIEGAMVHASIIDQIKDEKVLVFKKKRKKGYRVLNGHRQLMTRILIEDIIEKDAKPRIAEEKPKTARPKKTTAEIPVAEVKPEAAPVSKKEKKTAAVPAVKKPARVKTEEVKKPAARKSATSKKTAPAGKTSKGSKTGASKKTGTKKTK
jgi:large subunit ribosomal protein L21